MQPTFRSLPRPVIDELRRDVYRLAAAFEEQPEVAGALRGFADALLQAPSLASPPIHPRSAGAPPRPAEGLAGAAAADEGAHVDGGFTLRSWPPPLPEPAPPPDEPAVRGGLGGRYCLIARHGGGGWR